MTARIDCLTFDAREPLPLARFWAGALGWTIDEKPNGWVGVMPTDGTRFAFLCIEVPEPKSSKNPIHLDLVSESVENQREVVDRLLALGAQHVDVGQGPDVDHVVLADPEG